MRAKQNKQGKKKKFKRFFSFLVGQSFQAILRTADLAR